MKRIPQEILLILLIIVSLLTSDIYADCWTTGQGDCRLNPPFYCIPWERDWELYGANAFTCYCISGTGLLIDCMEIETGSYCTEWYDCDDECEDCVFNEDSSFQIHSCMTY